MKVILRRLRDGYVLIPPGDLSQDQARSIREAFKQWIEDRPNGVLIMPEADIEEIDVPLTMGGPEPITVPVLRPTLNDRSK